MIDAYDREGRPITFDGWSALMEYGDARRGPLSYRRVRLTEIDGAAVHVSTVWLGFDHGWGAGRPLIFETMVFYEHEPDGSFGTARTGGHVERYTTEEEALAGHRRIVRALREGAPLGEGTNATIGIDPNEEGRSDEA